MSDEKCDVISERKVMKLCQILGWAWGDRHAESFISDPFVFQAFSDMKNCTFIYIYIFK